MTKTTSMTWLPRTQAREYHSMATIPSTRGHSAIPEEACQQDERQVAQQRREQQVCQQMEERIVADWQEDLIVGCQMEYWHPMGD